MAVRHWEWAWRGLFLSSKCHSWLPGPELRAELSRQTSMTSGIILEMGKGFNASVGILGQDIGTLLLDACKRKVLDHQLQRAIKL